MPLTLRELKGSRSFEISSSGASLTREFILYRTHDEDEVLTEVLNQIGPTWNGLIRSSIKPAPVGGGVWHITVEYKNFAASGAAGYPGAPGTGPGSIATPDDETELGDPGSNGFNFEFDVSQNTVHVTQSIDTVSSHSAPGEPAAPNYQKAIGVTKDGVAGCDIFDGKLEITLTVIRDSVKLPYMRTLKNLVGKTNNALFHRMAVGEVLYLGASGRQMSDGINSKMSVSHRLGLGENQVNIDVGNGITVPSKKAWEYLWCVYAEKEIGGLLLQVPVHAYVEKVYREGNFAGLEIG